VLSTEPDPEILEVVDSTYTEPETELVGAPGQQVWTFRALAEGRTTLELSYERSSGETAGEPFDLTVEVG
jgi:predicted secreted protein